MSAQEGSAPTRTNLARARRRLDRVAKGIALLRRKREALIGEFFHLARPAVDARAVIERSARDAYAAFLEALAVEGLHGLRVLGWPARDLRLEIHPRQVWGIGVSDIVDRPALARTLEARGTAPGITGPSAVRASEEFERLVDRLLDAAPRELLIQRLGDVLSRTTRQVTTLEHRVGPSLESRATLIRQALEEREREERLRLRHLSRRRATLTAVRDRRAPAERTS